MRYLLISEILDLHQRLIKTSGGALVVRDMGALESAVFQPCATFENQDLYPDIVTKAAALCFSLVLNHPFVDGNKRIGHAAMETFMILNGCEVVAEVDVQERIILDIAAGNLGRMEFVHWLREHTKESLH